MKLKVLTLPFDPASGRFDDTELLAFCESTEVLSVSEHVFHHEGLPSWSILVSYRDRAAQRRAAPEPPSAPEPEIPAPDRPVFEALRHWRNQRAKRDGRPPYALFTNAQLAAIASARPTTPQALYQVPGSDPRLR